MPWKHGDRVPNEPSPRRFTAEELRLLDRVLQMESGTILDFSDRAFAQFLSQHGVKVTYWQYSPDAASTAKRLSELISVVAPTLAASILLSLLNQRLHLEPEVPSSLVEKYRDIIAKLVEPAETEAFEKVATGERKADLESLGVKEARLPHECLWLMDECLYYFEENHLKVKVEAVFPVLGGAPGTNGTAWLRPRPSQERLRDRAYELASRFLSVVRILAVN